MRLLSGALSDAFSKSWISDFFMATALISCHAVVMISDARISLKPMGFVANMLH